MSATLSFRLNMFVIASIARGLARAAKCAEGSYHRERKVDRAGAVMPQLRGVSARLRNFFHRRREALFILDVERADRTLDLPKQTGQDAARADFDERIHAL